MLMFEIISNNDWGGDRPSPLEVYWSHIRLKLDYCGIVYGSARQMHLEVGPTASDQGLKSCSGAFKTSPIAG